MQRDPTQWPRALEFLPERWLQGELEEAPRPGGGPWPKPYLPFSLGPRNCVGMMLAKAEIAMTLCQLIRNYKFSFAGDEEPRIAVSLSLTPNHMPMRIERRPKM
jgi:cytochrome P450